jgi:ABC-2 type transport system ATP-binding protein
VIAAGTPAELKALAGDDRIEVHVRDAGELSRVADVLAKIGRDPRTDPPTRRASVSVDEGSSRLMEVLRALDQQGMAVEDISLRRPTLDEVFLALTGRPPETTDPAQQPASV